MALSQDVVNVLHQTAQQADFVHESRQVVVQKQCTLHEKVRHKVDQIAEEESEADALKFSPFLVAQINDLSTTP